MHSPGGWEDPIEEPFEDDQIAEAFRCLRATPVHVALWDAINAYAVACGADPGRKVYGCTSRMDAVVRVEQAVKAMAAAVVNEP
jgi:hypothetical protein